MKLIEVYLFPLIRFAVTIFIANASSRLENKLVDNGGRK